MSNIVTMAKNGHTPKVVKQGGFSWTTFLLGPLPAMARGMWPQVAIMLVTMGWAWFYYIFFLDHDYYEKLLNEGWRPL